MLGRWKYMQIIKRQKAAGFVLPITLIVLAVLTVLSMGLSQSARQDSVKIQQRKQLLNDELTLKNSQQWVLYQLLSSVPDKNFMRLEGAEIPVDNQTIKHGEVSIKIQDSAGLMGLYYYRHKVFKSLLSSLLVNDEAMRVSAQLKDWIDTDSRVSHQGMELAQYIEAHEKMLPRNNMIRSLDELLELPGMTKELFNGVGQKPGLKELLLAGGVTGFNISTAPNILIGPMLGLSGNALAQVLQLKKSANWEQLEKLVTNMPSFTESSPFDQSYQYRIIMTLQSGVQARSLVRLTPSKERPYRYKLWQYPDDDRG